MKNGLQILTSFLISLAIMGAGAYLFFGLDLASWQRVKELRVELAERQTVMNQLTDLVSKFRERVASFENLNDQIELIDTSLPASLGIPELLAAISGAAGSGGEITLEGITFSTIESRFNAQSGPVVSRGLGNQTDIESKKVRLSISANGNYLAAKAFIKALEEEQRLIDISDLNFRPSGVRESRQETATSTTGLGGAFTFQVDANVYYIEKPTFTLP